MAKIDLSNPKKRDALPVRTSYYSHALGSKRYVLLRKGARGSTWGARVPGQSDVAIGDASAMTFDQAASVVRGMAGGIKVLRDVVLDMAVADVDPDALRTIGEAVDAYVANAALTKGKASMTNIRSHVKAIIPLRPERVQGCSLAKLNTWKADLINEKRGPVGANKVIGTLKAALNADGIGGAWEKLKKHKEPTRGVADRAPVMTADQVKALLKKAAETDPELHDFIKALWLTGARPGEIVSATRAALTGNALTLSGKTGTRDIVLTPGVAKWFKERAKSCNSHLIEFDGKPLGGESHRYRWARLIIAMEDSVPAGVSLYVIRHSFITAALYANVPIFAVAGHTGTSPEMIQQTYGHILAQMQSKALGALETVLL